MKKIFTLVAAALMAVSVSAQENFARKLDKTMVIYTTDDVEFVKYNEEDEENVTTYYNDANLVNALKKVGIPLTLNAESPNIHGAKNNTTYTLRQDYKDDATGFEIKAGQYRGLFVDGEIGFYGTIYVDGANKNMTGFTNLKQVVLYFVPMANARFKDNITKYGDPTSIKTYGEGRLQVMYMNPDNTQLTNKAFRDTKVKKQDGENYYYNQINPVQYETIWIPNLMNASIKKDASMVGGLDYSNVTCDRPFKLVYNVDNKLDAPEEMDPNKDYGRQKNADYLDLQLAADQTEATVNYYFAKKEDTSAYTDSESAKKEVQPIYSATGYNTYADRPGEKSPWSPETIVRPYFKQYFYLVGFALVSGTDGAASEYLNTNCDASGYPVMKAFSAEHIAAYGTIGTPSGINTVNTETTKVAPRKQLVNGQIVIGDYNIAGQRVK